MVNSFNILWDRSKGFLVGGRGSSDGTTHQSHRELARSNDVAEPQGAQYSLRASRSGANVTVYTPYVFTAGEKTDLEAAVDAYLGISGSYSYEETSTATTLLPTTSTTTSTTTTSTTTT